MNSKQDIVIIGGGASGFFAAANLDENLFNVTILEQGKEVLQKVKISGGGRCNVTHACFDPKELVQYYPRGGKELLSVFHQFQPADTMSWFEERGVPLNIEKDNRIFPLSNQSESIVKILKNETNNKNFRIETQKTVCSLNKKKEKYQIITTDNTVYIADIIVFSTGSSLKSYQLLEKLGHTIINPVPSLFTFNCKNEIINDLMGTSFENVNIKIPELKYQEAGPMLITHWGISGPAVLKLSAWCARELAELKYQFKIIVNFIEKDKKVANEDFLLFKKENPKNKIGHSKIFPVTNRFWTNILKCSKVDEKKNIADISNKDINQILDNLFNASLEVNGKSTYKDEFVTAGGVDLKEINFKTMQSKILPNFFLAGEVLNIDAITGGFNFQACWSEGWIIAQHLNNS